MDVPQDVLSVHLVFICTDHKSNTQLFCVSSWRSPRLLWVLGGKMWLFPFTAKHATKEAQKSQTCLPEVEKAWINHMIDCQYIYLKEKKLKRSEVKEVVLFEIV